MRRLTAIGFTIIGVIIVGIIGINLMYVRHTLEGNILIQNIGMQLKGKTINLEDTTYRALRDIEKQEVYEPYKPFQRNEISDYLVVIMDSPATTKLE